MLYKHTTAVLSSVSEHHVCYLSKARDNVMWNQPHKDLTLGVFSADS